MKKPTLGVDMDGVIASLVKNWVAVINECEGENVHWEEITSWHVDEFFDCGDKVFTYLEYSLFRNLPVMDDAIRVVKALMEKYDVYIVSSATEARQSLIAKMEWLEEYFPFIPASNIVLCGSKSIIKCDILIDDSPRNLSDVSDAYGILFDAPHNHNQEKDRFIRAMNWNEIEKILLPNEEE